MPLQNRVTPLSELVADSARGLVYGNRGCLHDAHGRIRRRYNGKRWIACRLEFRGRHRAALQQPGRYTELFFLDEATAFAAGHRPCAECRREDYERLTAIWRELHPGQIGADAIDAQLHDERVDWVRAGQALQRVLLEATASGLAASFMNQPLEQPALRGQVRSPTSGVGHSHMIMRIGFGDPVPSTPRRPVSAVRRERSRST